MPYPRKYICISANFFALRLSFWEGYSFNLLVLKPIIQIYANFFALILHVFSWLALTFIIINLKMDYMLYDK